MELVLFMPVLPARVHYFSGFVYEHKLTCMQEKLEFNIQLN